MNSIFMNTLNTRSILEDSLKYIRSDVPTKISEEEKNWLLQNNIITIVDLRTEEERIRKECPLSKDMRFSYHCMPVTGGSAIIIDDYMKSESNLKVMLEDYAKQNQEVDIHVITPHERYIRDFIEWYIANSGKKKN